MRQIDSWIYRIHTVQHSQANIERSKLIQPSIVEYIQYPVTFYIVSMFQMYWYVCLLGIFSDLITDMGCSLSQYRQTIGLFSGGSPRKWPKERRTTMKLRRGKIIPIVWLFLLFGAHLHIYVIRFMEEQFNPFADNMLFDKDTTNQM